MEIEISEEGGGEGGMAMFLFVPLPLLNELFLIVIHALCLCALDV